MKPTIEINETNFEVEVLQSKQPVLVDFWADWCGPCKMLAPVLDEIATEQSARMKVAKVNVDHHPALAARFGIQSIPTLLYVADGKVRHQTVGFAGKQTIPSLRGFPTSCSKLFFRVDARLPRSRSCEAACCRPSTRRS